MKCTICSKEVKLSSDGRMRSICSGCNTKLRRWKCKQKAVDYKGGKCIKCGFDEDISALEFHHRDPNEKEFGFSSLANKKWETLVDELDKCDMLCSNCHRIEHTNIYENFLNALKDRGVTLTLSERRDAS